jgi:hypothetical protein
MMHKAELQVVLRMQLLLQSVKKYKSPDIDQIPAELVQAGGEILLSLNHELVHFIWYK